MDLGKSRIKWNKQKSELPKNIQNIPDPKLLTHSDNFRHILSYKQLRNLTPGNGIFQTKVNRYTVTELYKRWLQLLT